MGVKLAAASGGSVELVPTNTASNYTVTFPASTGTVLTTTSPKAGNVLQVVNATNSTLVSTTSSSFTATGLTASITPTSASSKILVLFSVQYFLTLAQATTHLRLYRNGASIQPFIYTGYAGNSPLIVYPTCVYLDAPATTSSTTYAVYFNSSGVNIYYNYQDGSNIPLSTITLMEIAA